MTEIPEAGSTICKEYELQAPNYLLNGVAWCGSVVICIQYMEYEQLLSVVCCVQMRCLKQCWNHWKLPVASGRIGHSACGVGKQMLLGLGILIHLERSIELTVPNSNVAALVQLIPK